MDTPKSIPITCTLNEMELSSRQTDLFSPLLSLRQETRELPSGYAFRFPNDQEVIDQLNTFIQSERQCCAFFKFSLTFEPNQGPIWLEISGGDGVKSFLESQSFLIEAFIEADM